jgi:hypothetical protein
MVRSNSRTFTSFYHHNSNKNHNIDTNNTSNTNQHLARVRVCMRKRTFVVVHETSDVICERQVVVLRRPIGKQKGSSSWWSSS